MTRSPLRYRLSGALGFAALAVTLGAAIYYRHDVAESLRRLVKLNPVVLLAVPLFLLWNHVATYSWAGLLAAMTADAPTVGPLALIRIQGQAINLVVPAAGIGGEVARAAMASRLGGSRSVNAAAVVLDKIADAVAGFAFAVVIAAAYSSTLTRGGYGTWPLVIGGLVLVFVLACLPFIVVRVAEARRWSSTSRIGRLMQPLREAPAQVRWAFVRGIGWHLVERVLIAMEIYLAVRALGEPIAISQAMFVSALLTVATLAFFFIPGQAGAADASLITGLTLVGLSPAVGLSVAFVRRIRQVAVLVLSAGLWLRSRLVDTTDVEPSGSEKKKTACA